MGLSVSDAVRILLKRVVNDQAIPQRLGTPFALGPRGLTY